MIGASSLPEEESYEAPALIAEDAILFPEMQVAIMVRDPKNVAASEQAFKEHNLVVLVPMSSGGTTRGAIGTLVLLQRSLQTKEGGVQLLSKGLWRVRIQGIVEETPYVRVKFTNAGEGEFNPARESPVIKEVLNQIDEFARLIPGIPQEIITLLKDAGSPGKLADMCAYSPFFTFDERLDLLRTLDGEERLTKINGLFEKQLNELKNLAKARTIAECPTCMDLADKAFDMGPGKSGEVAREFINHVVQDHTDELLALLAGKYGPAFMRRRAMK